MRPSLWHCCVLTGLLAVAAAVQPQSAAAQAVPMNLAPGTVHPQTNNSTTVTGVRVGVHGNATRIVLDVSSPTKFGFQSAATGNAVFVDLPGARWTAPGFGAPHNRGLLTDFRFGAAPDGGGQLSLLTTQPVKIQRKFLLPPSGKRGYRIVFDLVAAANPDNRFQSASAAPTPNEQTLLATSPMQSERGRSAGSPIGSQPTEIAQVQFPRRAPTPQGAPTGAMQAQSPFPPAQQRPPQHQQMAPTLSPFYVKGGLGIGFASGGRNEGAGNDNTTEFDTGFQMTGAVGIDLRNSFRVEGEMLYSSNEAKSIIGTAAGTALNTGTIQGDVASLSFMANVAYDIPNQTRLTPFVFGGAGISGIFLNQIEAGNAQIYDDVDWVLSLQAGVGVNMAVDERLSLEAMYRYFEASNPEFNDSAGNPFESEFSSHYLSVGARYKF